MSYKQRAFFVLLLCLCAFQTAFAQPDPSKCVIKCNTTEPVSIFLGFYGLLYNMFAYDAQLYGGQKTNAMITIEVRDSNNVLIEGYGAGINVFVVSGNLTACEDNIIQNGGGGGGIAWWDVAAAGGSADHVVVQGYVKDINGDLLFTLTPLIENLRFNSADINGDHKVNLSDTALFARKLRTGYDYSIDFYYDGTINNSDTVYFSQAMNAKCWGF